MSAATSYDVIVLGAGAAGLAAAAELTRGGARVLLLEARARVGGRIWTCREAGLSVPAELGAEFIHGHAPRTRELLADCGVAMLDAVGSRWTLAGGQPVPSDAWFAELMQAIGRTDVLRQRDMPFDEFVQRHLAAALSPQAQLAARRMAEGFDAADTARASARAIVSEWQGDTLGGVPQSRPAGGYAALLGALLQRAAPGRLTLRLQCPVHSVRWSRGAVEVMGESLGASYSARAARLVVTLPLGVLQQQAGAGAVRFEPPLAAKAAALSGLASGAVVKVLLRFDEPFWEHLAGGRYHDASFFHATGSEVPTFWTNAPARAPLLIAWAGGPRAARLAAAPNAVLVRAALAGIESLFGRDCNPQERLQGYLYHDWQHDPYACGAYSYVLVGGDQARAQLAEPLGETLYFAGEATDTQDEAGTVTGALDSGVRAAREALAR